MKACVCVHAYISKWKNVEGGSHALAIFVTELYVYFAESSKGIITAQTAVYQVGLQKWI